MNNIRLSKDYIRSMIDEYMTKKNRLISCLENDYVYKNIAGTEFMLPVVSVDGMADHVREEDIIKGDVSIVWETMRYAYERSRKYVIDEIDVKEALGDNTIKFIMDEIHIISNQEIDAYTLSSLANQAGDETEATITSAAELRSAIANALEVMDNGFVPQNGRILFISSALAYKYIENAKDYLYSSFEQIIIVPEDLFYNGITLWDGTTEGETAGGWVPGSDSKKINFLVVQKDSVVIGFKTYEHVIEPANNGDQLYIISHRVYGLIQHWREKASGIFAHIKPNG